MINTLPSQHPARWLKAKGYLPGVKLNEIDRLDRGSADFMRGCLHLQNFVGHAEIGDPDAVFGPRTRAYIDGPICPVPDHLDEEIASARHSSNLKRELGAVDPDWLRDQHQKLRLIKIAEANNGVGSWPPPCQNEGVTVSIDDSRAPRGVDVDKMFSVAQEQFGQVGCKLVRHAGGGRANIRVMWKVLAGSTIGLAEFNNRSCSDSVFNQLDPGYYPSPEQLWQLFIHELGHNMNLQHTRGGVMNPSIVRWSGGFDASDPSWRTLVRFFGGDPVTPDKPDPRPPDDDSGITGDVTLTINGKKHRFFLTPYAFQFKDST